MYPYSEYIQELVYSTYGSHSGDKPDFDFRISRIGMILRKYWIDELPMLINLFKREIKLVGVRPLSFAKLKTYPKEFIDYRSKFKPGLLPPYYADIPKNRSEMILSEKNYLKEYTKSPFKTDLSYFFKIMLNIIFKGARSK